MQPLMTLAAGLLLAATALTPATALAQKKYDPGASDTEIKIGQTMPYSGPASAYGSQGKTTLAYFKMLNSKGGINGRKVNLLSLDDFSHDMGQLRRAQARVARESRPPEHLPAVGGPAQTRLHPAPKGRLGALPGDRGRVAAPGHGVARRRR